MRSALVPCILLIFASACADRTGRDAGAAGGTLVIATGSAATPLLPSLAPDANTRNIADQVYDKLAQIGPDLGSFGDVGFTPRLARSWSWAADSLSIAFSIDPNARWHDGRPVRASDVKYSFDVLKDPNTGSPATSIITNVDSVSVRDSMTAVAWFHQRSPEQFFDLTYQLHIIPEHVMKDVPHDKLAGTDMSQRLIGSGRFRLARFEPGVRIELIADTANYRGRPKLDRIIWSFSSDAGSAITQLLSGQADLYENLPAAVLPSVDSSGRVRVDRFKGLGIAYMGMNLRGARRPGSAHPVFGDRQVRRAISMAMDRQAMLRNVFDTVGTISNGPVAGALADTTIHPPPFDRARAAALLDSAGWRTGADGVRVKNGRPLAFSLLVPTASAPRMRYAVLIQEQLKAIGARVTIDAIDFQAFVGRQNARDFDAALMSFSSDPSLGGMKQYWHTSSIGAGGQNHLGYTSPVMDAALDSAILSFDRAARGAHSRRAVQAIVDDVPAVWLYEVLANIGVNKRVRTTDMRPDGWWAGLAEWWIPEGERIDRDRIGLRPAQP